MISKGIRYKNSLVLPVEPKKPKSSTKKAVGGTTWNQNTKKRRDFKVFFEKVCEIITALLRCWCGVVLASKNLLFLP